MSGSVVTQSKGANAKRLTLMMLRWCHLWA